MRKYNEDDFALPSGVRRKVLKLINGYGYYDRLRKKSVVYEDYVSCGRSIISEALGNPSYIGDPTGNSAERIFRAENERRRAGEIVTVIDAAIDEASEYSYPSKRKGIVEMLRKNLIDRVGRDYLGCNVNVLAKYRRIVFFIVARDMKMIPDCSLLRTEKRPNETEQDVIW